MPLHVLLTNDDGPPNPKSSPYIETLVREIKKETDWQLSIAVPHVQRSWIGKAHIIEKNITAQYLYSTLTKCDDTRHTHSQCELHPDAQEWVLLDGTPATCANIGVNHLYPEKPPVDLVISGPNYGRNTSAAYILSSGTVGAALEGAICGVKSIAVSFSYTSPYDVNDPQHQIDMGSKIAVRLIKYLYSNWCDEVQLYSINIPLSDDLNLNTEAHITPIFENNWSSIFARAPQQNPQDSVEFIWSPRFELCDKNVLESKKHSDAWSVLNGSISVTPLRAVFHGIHDCHKRIPHLATLFDKDKEAVVSTTDKFVSQMWKNLFAMHQIKVVDSREDLKTQEAHFEYLDYELIDFDERSQSQRNPNLVYSFVYRKALIRKNHLANVVAYYKAKHPNSTLAGCFQETFNLEVDFPEFLDECLDEACELRQELESKESNKAWILKPALGDRGHGIRIFKTIEGLRSIFKELEEQQSSNDEDETASTMRQFVVQEYMQEPLLVDDHKFHLRVYVLAVGALKVYVYKNMLALFASKPFEAIVEGEVDLQAHITNTCYQETASPRTVRLFADLGIPDDGKNSICEQIMKCVGEVFEAASGDVMGFRPVSNAFEFFGLDFIVDSKFRASLLEVNAYPDFAQTGDELQSVVDGLFEATHHTVIEPFYKHGLSGSVEVSSKLELVFEKDYKM